MRYHGRAVSCFCVSNHAVIGAEMKKINTHQLKKILLLTLIYAMMTFIVMFFVINAINSGIVLHPTALASATPAPPAIQPSVTPPAVTASKYSDFLLTSLPSDAENITFSDDGQYCVALYGGKIEVADIKTDKLIHTISDIVPVTSYILLHHQNILIYFLMDTAKGQLLVKTYNISSEIETTQKTIAVSADSRLKQVDYSSSMSLVFFNIETGGGKYPIDTVYYLNANKALNTMKTNGVINEMTPLNKTMNLNYESGNHFLFSNAEPVADLKNISITLLGCDGDDNVYVQTNNIKARVYVLNNDKVLKTIELDDVSPYKAVSDKSGVYLVYGDHIIKLSGDAAVRLDFDQDLKFLGLAGGRVYFSKGASVYTSIENTL